MMNCERCWDNPCRCGHEYRNWTPEELKSLISVLQAVLTEREKGQVDNEERKSRARIATDA